MAESKFINPLFQRTDPATRRRPDALEGPAQGPNIAVGAPHAVALPDAGHAPVKFTFYFTPSQLDRLDQLWLRTKLEHREKLNKSEFVRLAIDRLMDEFDKDPKTVLTELKRHRVQ